ncbi:hypothetical protein PRIPAC_88422 [Pristionchus pacificus]|uniref:Uncharacterized protein n=1 Tax=Pristionchus pacificus TaxID=54126 RepID=A0A2A6B831_PRIPA|nr:hypothetical protein PRIPAC_88422 [Pristionchus pacificus]|eukprot:PDM62039.1 hypothetical protein PRIPAC_51481 [Pristionchus pacificus]
MLFLASTRSPTRSTPATTATSISLEEEEESAPLMTGGSGSAFRKEDGVPLGINLECNDLLKIISNIRQH